MRVFVKESDSVIADRHFEEQPVLVGSGADSTIRLADPRIAERQLQLIPDGATGWTVELLAPSGQVRLNGATLLERQPVKNLDEIALGAYVLKIYLDLDAPKDSSGRLPLRTESPRKAEFVLPVGGFARRPGGKLALPCERLDEFAALAVELAGMSQIEPMVARILQQALTSFRARVASMCVRQRTTAGLEIVRAIDAKGRPVDAPALTTLLHERCTHGLQRICLPDSTEYGSASAMAVPILSSRTTALAMIYVETGDPQSPYDGEALDVLASLASVVARPLERAIHGVETIRAEIAGQEQIVARQVQDAVTPRAMPEWPEVQVAVYRRPGSARCRDIYDVMRLANRTASLVLARIDATGAMLPRIMAELRASFRTSCLHADAPHVFARALNWLIGDAHAQWTVDLAGLWIMPGSGLVKYCIAGAGISVGVISGRGDCRMLETDNAPSVGRQRGFAYASKTDKLEPGEVLAIVSDGADSFCNATGDPIGRENVREHLCDAAGTAINLMLADLARELDDYAPGGSAPDDVTVLLARRQD